MKLLNLCMLCMLLNMSLPAQILTPVRSHHKLSKTTLKKGDDVTLIFTLSIDDNWHVYSNNQNYELGPLPAYFTFEPHPSYKRLGSVIPVGSKQAYEPVFEVYVNYFEKTAEFRQKIKLCTNNPIVKGYYDYQVCSTKDGKCMQQTADFEFKIKTIN